MPSEKTTKSYTRYSYMDTIADIMAHSQFLRSQGPSLTSFITRRSLLSKQHFILKPQVGLSTKFYDLRGSVCKLLWSFYITCSVLHLVKNRKPQNNFRCCATLDTMTMISLISSICTVLPLTSFARTTFLRNPPSSDKHLLSWFQW